MRFFRREKISGGRKARLCGEHEERAHWRKNGANHSASDNLAIYIHMYAPFINHGVDDRVTFMDRCRIQVDRFDDLNSGNTEKCIFSAYASRINIGRLFSRVSSIEISDSSKL